MIKPFTFSAILIAISFSATANADGDRYGEIVRQHEPVGWWRMNAIKDDMIANEIHKALPGRVQGDVRPTPDAPLPSAYPDFSSDNRAMMLSSGNYLIVEDPGSESLLDFSVGQSLTLEAWVKIDRPLKGSYPYIIGKGRTHNPGTNHNNQSYALRLATAGGGAAISFFFVDESGATTSIEQAGHRWTSKESVPQDGLWHHVAVTYTFGQEDSLRGYIDGKSVSGKWDMAGATSKAPITDDDELWIGASMGGGSSLGAGLDEVALYRKALTEKQIQQHVNIDIQSKLFAFDSTDIDAPQDHVRVDILEGLSAGRSWDILDGELETTYRTDVFAMKQVPRKYNDKGLIIDRPIPSLLRLSSEIEFAGGDYEFFLRSLDASRLYVDGKLVAETKFMGLDTSAHQAYYEMPDYGDDVLSIAGGHLEDRDAITLKPGRHVVTLYRMLGNKGHGNHLGELHVGVSRNGGKFEFLAPERNLAYTDASWLNFLDEDRERLLDWNQQVRLANSEKEAGFWTARHEWAKSQVGEAPKVPTIDNPRSGNSIDHFIFASLNEQNEHPTGEISDLEFLRRASLDTIGKIPTRQIIAEYLSQPKETRREFIIDRLHKHPGWADHWTTYWQDALAENPGLTKPMLNNTGPFRWFIYESMLDNKPIDRFVTELIMMEGSPYTGGPAGFSIASQNDVPMAAKAHVLGTAFLAVEMKCARCHDAPYHDVKQEDLFNVAAMLKRRSEQVPGSSTIPLSEEEIENLAVKVTLQPGSIVKPNWPFVEFVSSEDDSVAALPEQFVRKENDPRSELARMMTSPKNNRFAKVLVNRVWARLIGRGIVHPVDDWEEAEPSHPELLDFLAHQFVSSGYDLKAISKLIMSSNLYQRAAVAGLSPNSEDAALFRGPLRRKMTGEQVVDSLFTAVGKPFRSEELTMDGDGRRDDKVFVHLGEPTRGWQLTPVSNERDRPSMTLPVAQSLVDLMSAYGWRQQRQEPLTHREDPLTALQPMALSNGTSSLRAIDFSDDSALTQAAIESETPHAFIETLFERILTRTPTSEEREFFLADLSAGFEDRIIAGPDAVPPKRIFRTGITWSNHFDPKSDDEAIARMREVIEGDPKSARLDPEWRKRAEDVAWVLVNSPEFVFVP